MSDEMRNRVLAGAPESDGDERIPEEVLAAASDAAKDRWIGIFVQLTNSHRFNTFLEDNFIIQDRIDEEKKTIETLVVEKPLAVGPPLSPTQLTELRTLLKIANCTQPEKVFESVLKLLGQEENSLIVGV